MLKSRRAPREPTLVRRQTAAFALVAGPLIAGLGFWLWSNAGEHVLTEAAATAKAAGQELAQDEATVRLVGLAALFPEREHVQSWTGHGDAIARSHSAFVRTGALHGEDRVRLLVPKTSGGFHGPGQTDVEGFFVTVSNAATPEWLRPVVSSPGLRRVWEGGISESHLNVNAQRVVTWARITNTHGRPVGVLELTRTIKGPLAAERRKVTLALACVGSVLTVLGMALARLAGRVDRDLLVSRRALRRLQAGDRSKSPAEEGVLTAEVERLREALVVEEQAAAATDQDLRSNLAAAEALLAPGLVARRQSIAARVGNHRLLVRVGEAIAEEVELVDLAYGRVHVRSALLSAVDLAPGMPVEVGWNRERPSLCELRVRRRIETDEGVQYVLGGDVDLELPGTPTALRAVAYPRLSQRVDMTGTAASVCFVVDGAVGPVLTLVNLSAGGARVNATMSLEEAARAGTRATMELMLPGLEGEVRTAVVVRRVFAIATGTTFDLEFVDDGGPGEGRRRVAAWLAERQRAAA